MQLRHIPHLNLKGIWKGLVRQRRLQRCIWRRKRWSIGLEDTLIFHASVSTSLATLVKLSTLGFWISGVFQYASYCKFHLMMMKLMFDRKEQGEGYVDGGVVPRAEKIYKENRDKACFFNRVPSTQHEWSVVDAHGNSWSVHLLQHTCDCHYWKMTGIPRPHVIQASFYNKNADWKMLLDPYHSVANYRQQYAGYVGTMPDQRRWPKPQPDAEGKVFKVLAPPFARPLGRPRSQRRKDADEGGSNKNTKQCGKCGVIGHYRSTCTGLTAEQIAERGGVSTDLTGPHKRRTAARDFENSRPSPPSEPRTISPEDFLVTDPSTIDTSTAGRRGRKKSTNRGAWSAANYGASSASTSAPMQATSAQIPTSMPANTPAEHNYVGMPRGGSIGGRRGGNAGGRVARGAEYLLFGEGGVDGVEPTSVQPVWMPPGTSTTTTTRGRNRGRPTNAEKRNMVHRRHGTVFGVGILNPNDTLNPPRGTTPVFRAPRVQVEPQAAIPQVTEPDHQPTSLQNTCNQ
ncbi:uncharacterized protein LOC113332692 [Papaver somniferum]|uniref:uncharacterized protein LOC113332692 n=1 Tax=Papaver somniferum TaxID=3469 RepID=UPI000E703960|nr:uncharacterized protein LOC113332692 [Papaver somniferum]XP_026434996.1 uncharacterized protein LOC113332692 [Papaver somniferum]XP_026434997.1 uncharacterized protein LOC113332692 [Papaver somniferum]XP_026434998.1 uncharacterized protein LOC113332692 [Papaver somniferum]